MIKATVVGQVLNVKTPLIFSGTYNYIKGEIDFNEDWSLATARYARFYLDSEHDYTVELDEQNRFGYREEDHIALSKGRWKFWLVGYATQEGGTAEQIITTNAVDLVSKITGESFPELQPSVVEMAVLLTRRLKEEAENAKNAAEAAADRAGTSKNAAEAAAGAAERAAAAAAESEEMADQAKTTAVESAVSAALSAQHAEQIAVNNGYAAFDMDDDGNVILTRTANIADKLNFALTPDGEMEVFING